MARERQLELEFPRPAPVHGVTFEALAAWCKQRGLIGDD